LGLAFGLSPQELRLDHHVIATRSALDKIELKV
jgi:heterodisulfide reductase subunit B